MNKNQKRTITRSYNNRLDKVLELTRQKPLFPAAIIKLVFDFAKSMAIGEKMTKVEIKEGKTLLHQALITIQTVHEIDENLFTDKDNRAIMERVVDFLTIVPWPLSKNDRLECQLLKHRVYERFVEGAPQMFLLTLERRFERFPFDEAKYTPEKWLR